MANSLLKENNFSLWVAKISGCTMTLLLVLSLLAKVPAEAATQGAVTQPVQNKTTAINPAVAPSTGLEKILNQVPVYKGPHSTCYWKAGTNPDDVKGVNVDHQVRLASVTKLLTSFWVVSKLGPNYQFKTTFVWDPTTAELFIQGSRDPFFGRRRLNLLISDLSRMGIRQINKVYFDRNFHYFQGVENPENYHTEITQHGGIPRSRIATQLKHLMNIREWTNEDRSYYASFRQVANVLGVKNVPATSLDLSVLDVEPVEANPLEGRAGLTTFVSASPKVMNYLKQLNMYSMNYPADELFYLFGGRASFAQFLVEKLNLSEEDARVFTGSGLPFMDAQKRFDTTTNCGSMVKVIVEMRNELAKHKLDLPDIMMVGGIDRGTLNGAFKQDPLRGTVVAKTGTLANAVTLAGFVNTRQGRVYFGIFLQTTNIAQARAARNQLVLRIANKHGGTKSVGRTRGFQFVSFGPQSNLKKLEVPSTAPSEAPLP